MGNEGTGGTHYKHERSPEKRRKEGIVIEDEEEEGEEEKKSKKGFPPPLLYIRIRRQFSPSFSFSWFFFTLRGFFKKYFYVTSKVAVCQIYLWCQSCLPQGLNLRQISHYLLIGSSVKFSPRA